MPDNSRNDVADSAESDDAEASAAALYCVSARSETSHAFPLPLAFPAAAGAGAVYLQRHRRRDLPTVQKSGAKSQYVLAFSVVSIAPVEQALISYVRHALSSVSRIGA